MGKVQGGLWHPLKWGGNQMFEVQDFNGRRWGTAKYVDPMTMRNVSFPNLYGSFFDSIYTPNFVFS